MKKTAMGDRAEVAFSLTYLVFLVFATMLFMTEVSDGESLQLPLLSFILLLGDGFHLVPRILISSGRKIRWRRWWLGFGQLMTSVTMTFFYAVLFYIWKAETKPSGNIVFFEILMWILVIVRVLMCLRKENNWFEGRKSRKMSFERNVAFLIMGLMLSFLFVFWPCTGQEDFTLIGIFILISFSCYMPVALYADERPALAMLMIPKTLMYVFMIISLM